MKVATATRQEYDRATAQSWANNQIERNDEIERRFLAGERETDIAVDLGMTRQRVHQILTRRGIPTTILKEHRNAERNAKLDLARRTCPDCGVVWDRGMGNKHRAMHRWTLPPIAYEIKRRYEAGEKGIDIAASLDIYPVKMYRYLRMMDVPLHRPGHRKSTLDAAHARQAQIIELLTTRQYSKREIAERTNCSRAWVQKIAERIGL